LHSTTVCIVRSYNGSARSAAVSLLWKYDTCPIYITMISMLDEIYNNAH